MTVENHLDNALESLGRIYGGLCLMKVRRVISRGTVAGMIAAMPIALTHLEEMQK